MFDSEFINAMYTATIIGIPYDSFFMWRYEMCIYDSNI